ncbi:DUF4054 domain-containing protein [Methylobacterium nodulans]|uniref:DUF4054 domain-containing protein n=1 Tax=Methylobacterium nodulans (strain LMG 21967 / CNCM I-2342 / ORS 2060) TaxID=460265 RepID=B8INU2_METNO|nr:DUF4054 domain-containing protein [Methylobacterium nodulans]ACL58458.1 conserved hypothetical protein [Methylobacterium nodulans ORS 2060]
MAYTPPTAADFKLRFPAFDAVPDQRIAGFLEDAASVADDGWADTDRRKAVMLQAAHDMTTRGIGTGAEAELAAAGALGFTSFRSGQLQLDRSGTAAAASANGALSQTAYGRELLDLIRSRFPAVLVV